MIDRLDPRSGQLRSGLWCYNKLWKPAKTTPKMWRNFVFLQNSLFSWEVFTVISRKILFFWEKCHFEKNPIFFRKRQDFLPIFPVCTQPILWVILIDFRTPSNLKSWRSPTPKNYKWVPKMSFLCIAGSRKWLSFDYGGNSFRMEGNSCCIIHFDYSSHAYTFC